MVSANSKGARGLLAFLVAIFTVISVEVWIFEFDS